MHQPNETLSRQLSPEHERRPKKASTLPPRFLLSIALLILGFGLPLYNLIRFALNSDLFSYVLLVPFVSIYLFRQASQPSLLPSSPGPHRAVALVLFALGGAVLAGFWLATLSGVTLVQQDSLALTTLSFVVLVAAVSAFFLPRAVFRGAIFPLVFLLFMIPFPVAMEHAVEMFLQHGSAPPALWFFQLAGTPVFQQGMVFQLPGMTLQIAPECSGIRSSIVLFITSLVAGHLFLRSPWKRTLLAVVVIPLALLRNGFRVFTIGELCVHIGPHMIDSPIHHQGGPIFFALSLIPFSVLVFYLVKSDRPAVVRPPQPITT